MKELTLREVPHHIKSKHELYMPKEMIIEKNVSINNNIGEVFSFLKETRNQDKFSVWNMKDPNMKKSYSGIDGTKGFIYSWDSKDKNVGAGAQEIIDIKEGNRIDYEMRFSRPMQNTATASFVLDKIDENTTSVTWTFRSPTKFPMSLFSPIFKKILGKQLDQGLQNLKSLLDKK
ncbi:MAG TPA: SRPBCC family protein [Segetibacter sp.]|nr:SRPBCC family protein [Segetibacter sp.]